MTWEQQLNELLGAPGVRISVRERIFLYSLRKQLVGLQLRLSEKQEAWINTMWERNFGAAQLVAFKQEGEEP